jgi:hypothetical protein
MGRHAEAEATKAGLFLRLLVILTVFIGLAAVAGYVVLTVALDLVLSALNDTPGP